MTTRNAFTIQGRSWSGTEENLVHVSNWLRGLEERTAIKLTPAKVLEVIQKLEVQGYLTRVCIIEGPETLQ